MKYSSFAIVLAVASIVACGSSNKGSGGGSGNDAGADVTAPVEASAPEAAAEAGDDDAAEAGEPPDDGPWPADHYALPLFENGGGPVLTAPNLITVTFTGNPDTAALQTFDDAFAEGTAWWGKVTAGYSIGAASGGTHVALPDTVSNTTLDDDTGGVSGLVTSAIASGALPLPDGNTIYVLYFPSTTTITFEGGQSCQSFSGYHSMVQVPTEGGTVLGTYAVIPNCPAAGSTDQPMEDTTFAVSHEVIEATTDPYETNPTWGGYQVAWFRQGKTPVELEVADACENYAPIADPNGYYLTRSWVNQAAKASSDPCQPELAGEIYYAVAVPTTKQSPGAGYPDSDGYVVVPAGTTATVDCVFFSEAKLPNDAQITVGGRGQGGGGSTTLNPTLETGVTAAVTPTAAHNGIHVTLTIDAAASAVNGDFNARVRSTLKTGDSHDWPFIVRITGGADAGSTAPKDAGAGG